jgi:NADH dehydrogenase
VQQPCSREALGATLRLFLCAVAVLIDLFPHFGPLVVGTVKEGVIMEPQRFKTAEWLPGSGDDLLASARPPRILVLGGTGMLGQPVVHRLLADGYQVRVLSRSPDRARALLGEGCEMVGGDVDDLPSVEAALSGCAGVHVNLPDVDPGLESRGTAQVAQAAARAGVRRLSYVSGMTVSEANAWFPIVRAKLQAEEAIRQSGVPYSIFRLGFVMETLDKSIRGRVALVIGRHPHPFHMVAAADFARMVSAAYACPEAANKVLFIHGPRGFTWHQALRQYCALAHPGCRVVAIPFWLAEIIARVGRRAELRAALPFLRYIARVGEQGDPTEANALLGAPTITLEGWCRQQRDARLEASTR